MSAELSQGFWHGDERKVACGVLRYVLGWTAEDVFLNSKAVGGSEAIVVKVVVLIVSFECVDFQVCIMVKIALDILRLDNQAARFCDELSDYEAYFVLLR